MTTASRVLQSLSREQFLQGLGMLRSVKIPHKVIVEVVVRSERGKTATAETERKEYLRRSVDPRLSIFKD